MYESTPSDYPEIAFRVCEEVREVPDSAGILICGTGIGMSIAANKVCGIRCARCSDTYSARMAREHNNANVLAMGQRTVGTEIAKETLIAFINTKFANIDPHKRRVELLDRKTLHT